MKSEKTSYNGVMVFLSSERTLSFFLECVAVLCELSGRILRLIKFARIKDFNEFHMSVMVLMDLSNGLLNCFSVSLSLFFVIS